MKRAFCLAAAFAASALCVPAGAADGGEESVLLEGLRVREVTIFKDGHALVRHRGELPVTDGRATLRNLPPSPLLGTFWSESLEPGAPLKSVTASVEEVAGEARPARNLTEIARANPGLPLRVVLQPYGEREMVREVRGVVREIAEENDNTPLIVLENVQMSDETGLMLPGTQSGMLVLTEDQIREFYIDPSATFDVSTEEEAALLTLEYEGAGDSAETAISYVQRGLRWIPQYRITYGEGDTATVEMTATIVNDLGDLEDVDADLVVGVPTFYFENETDPMGLQALLGQTEAAAGYRMRAGDAILSNAVMSQVPSRGTGRGGGAAAPPPELPTSATEDLFVYRIEDLTLAKGARTVVSVARFEVPAEKAYALTIPMAPGPEEYDGANRVMPRSLLELENTSSYPITTAPALVFRGEQLVAQSRTEYTAIGGTLELDLTAAVNIRVELEGETERREVVNEEGMSFWRFDASGEITLENFLNEPVRIDVERYVAGEAKSASGGGEAITLTPGQFGMPGRGPGSGGGPGWSSLPGWWQQYNATGVVRWEDVELLPEEPVTLTYEWEYLWRR